LVFQSLLRVFSSTHYSPSNRINHPNQAQSSKTPEADSQNNTFWYFIQINPRRNTDLLARSQVNMSFEFTMLSTLVFLAFSFAPFASFTLARPVVTRQKWGFHPQNVEDSNGPSITCMSTYNQQTADLGNPQLCSLSALQYRSGVAHYYIYDPHCKLLGGSARQASRMLIPPPRLVLYMI
jgi:hypothetical protein